LLVQQGRCPDRRQANGPKVETAKWNLPTNMNKNEAKAIAMQEQRTKERGRYEGSWVSLTKEDKMVYK